MLPLSELTSLKSLWIRQRKELAELIGFETRNKYSIDTDDNRQIAFAAEQRKGWIGMLTRQLLGHWRSFDILIFDNLKQPVVKAHHPFRFFFQRLIVTQADGTEIGHIQRRWSILTKKFDVLDPQEKVLMTVSSPVWRIWTFQFKRDGRDVAAIRKRWGGILKEAMTDADQFEVEFTDPSLSHAERILMLTAGVFVDLMYFEQKGGSTASLLDLGG